MILTSPRRKKYVLEYHSFNVKYIPSFHNVDLLLDVARWLFYNTAEIEDQNVFFFA